MDTTISGTGMITALPRMSKLVHRRTPEEVLGIRMTLRRLLTKALEG